MKQKLIKTIAKISVVLFACALFASFSPSLDGRAVVADEGVFPEGYFAKTVGYLPGDELSVTNVSGNSTIQLLVIGALDPSEGVAILLSPEAAKAIGIEKDSNNIVKITKRAGQDERVCGTAMIAKSNEISSLYDSEEKVESTPATTPAYSYDAEDYSEDYGDDSDEDGEYTAEEFAAEFPAENDFIDEDDYILVENDEVPEEEFEETESDEEPFEEYSEDEEAYEEYAEDESYDEEEFEDDSEEYADDEDYEDESEFFVEDEDFEDDYEEYEYDDEPESEEEYEEDYDEEYAEEYADDYEAFEDDIPDESVPEDDFYVDEEEDFIVDDEEESEDFDVAPLASEYFVTDDLDTFDEEELGYDEEEIDYEEDGEYDEYDAIVLVPTDEYPPEIEDVVDDSSLEDVAEVEDVIDFAPTYNISPVNVPETTGFDKYIVRSFDDLQQGAYYIQIAVLREESNINDIISKYGKNYPIAIIPKADGKGNYILIGPLNVDEYGAVLARFKAYGYKDAFLRKIK